ncbi:MAG: hypothetical protein AB2693_13535, partial [Candidatus Thiodiazotropha sp.]
MIAGSSSVIVQHFLQTFPTKFFSTEDTVKLQEDIDRLGNWARSWGMRFQPVKCNIMQITRK